MYSMTATPKLVLKAKLPATPTKSSEVNQSLQLSSKGLQASACPALGTALPQLFSDIFHVLLKGVAGGWFVDKSQEFLSSSLGGLVYQQPDSN